MNRYERDAESLAPLETFDARAFLSNDKAEQQICDFVLGLALLHNDFKDVMFGHVLLSEIMPHDVETPTPQLGQIGGISLHLFRLLAGLLHELAQLIEDNQAVLASPQFSGIIKNLPHEVRNVWASVVSGVNPTPAASQLSRLVFFARNKIAFHYDRKAIAQGYARAFLDTGARQPYLSRGSNFAETRFYFADAAADAYMRNAADDAVVNEFFTAGTPIFRAVGHALREVVVRFINARGYGYRAITAT